MMLGWDVKTTNENRPAVKKMVSCKASFLDEVGYEILKERGQVVR